MITVTGFNVGPTVDGKFVGLKVTGSDGNEERLQIPPESIEALVVGLLGSVASCADLTQSKLKKLSEMKDRSIYAMARGVGAQDVAGRQNTFALNFLFGQTRLAIGLSKDVLPQLGSALL